MGFGRAQMISERKYQPSARRAKARSQGWPIRSFGLQPGAVTLGAPMLPVFVFCFSPALSVGLR